VQREIRKIGKLGTSARVFGKVLALDQQRNQPMREESRRSNGPIIAFVPDPEARRGESKRGEAR